MLKARESVGKLKKTFKWIEMPVERLSNLYEDSHHDIDPHHIYWSMRMGNRYINCQKVLKIVFRKKP